MSCDIGHFSPTNDPCPATLVIFFPRTTKTVQFGSSFLPRQPPLLPGTDAGAAGPKTSGQISSLGSEFNSANRIGRKISRQGLLGCSTMPNRIAIFLLTSVAATLAFVFMWIAWLVPRLFFSVYHVKTWDDLRDFMSPITKLATDYSWFIALLFGAVWLASILALRRFPDRTIQCVTVGLCAQGLVAWSAMFCFLYDELLGPMSMHHDPAFDFDTFIAFGGGVFPITLLFIVAPIIVALLPSKISRA